MTSKKPADTEQEEHSGESAAERGKQAIEAGRIADSAPEEEKKKEEEKDAEQWRNEG